MDAEQLGMEFLSWAYSLSRVFPDVTADQRDEFAYQLRDEFTRASAVLNDLPRTAAANDAMALLLRALNQFPEPARVLSRPRGGRNVDVEDGPDILEHNGQWFVDGLNVDGSDLLERVSQFREEFERIGARLAAESSAPDVHQPDAPADDRQSDVLETAQPEPGQADYKGPTHSPDFASVNWFGTLYEFTKTQAACVKVLWGAMANKAPTIGQETILELAEVSRAELRKVFEGHPAWMTMIVSPSKGRYRLNFRDGGKTGG